MRLNVQRLENLRLSFLKSVLSILIDGGPYYYSAMNPRLKKVLLASVFAVFFFGGSDFLFARKRLVLSNTRSVSSQVSTSDKDALYIIEDDFNLKGEKIRFPQGAILQFDGGRLINGEIVGHNSTIVAGRYEIFKDLSLTGLWTLDGLPVEWFGAIPNDVDYDCSKAINAAISTGVSINAPALLGSGTYYTRYTIGIPEGGALIGSSPSSTTIRFFAGSKIGLYMHGQNVTLRDVCVREHKMERKDICIKLGDLEKKVSCTRGYIEDVYALGGKIGLDMDYQWCNKITGIKCKYNETGLYAHSTTPYIENASIEGNYKCGVLSEGSGIKLYHAVIEGNRIGCILNGKENMLTNCYFEGNTSSMIDKNAAKDDYGFDVEGGHLYAGESSTITNLIMIGCHITNTYKNNNTIRIDKCLGFTSIGCNSLYYLDMTDNCFVKYVDNTFESVDEYGEYSLASRIPRGFSMEEPSLFQLSDFRDARISDTIVKFDENGYYQLIGNKTRFELYNGSSLLCLRKERVKYREIYFRVYDPQVLESDSDIVLSTSVQYPVNMADITPSQSLSLTGKTKAGKTVTVKIGNGHTSTNKKVRAGQIISYDVRIKRSFLDNLAAQNGISRIEFITMNNSLVYGSTDITSDGKAGNEFALVNLSVSLAKAR